VNWLTVQQTVTLLPLQHAGDAPEKRRLSSTVGAQDRKNFTGVYGEVDVMKNRILDINPECKVDALDTFYTKEKEIKTFAESENLPVYKSPCPADGNTERARMKELLAPFDKAHPGLYHRIMGAIQRGEVDGFHEDRIDQAEKLRRKNENNIK
jgi:hypothetical protein